MSDQVSPLERLLDVPETADYIRRSPKAIYHLVAAGKIPYCRVAGRIMFRPSDLVAWLDAHAVLP